MEVDEFQRQVTKFQRVSSNGSSTTTTDNSSNPNKIATRIGNFEVQNHVEDGRGARGGGGGGDGGIDVVVGGGGVARLCGWPASRIVRVSRASGGKDRHSKVLTSKGLRDRRVRLSVGTAIQFYDLQDRLGYDQPSKAVEWLLKAASSSIDELPSLDLPIVGSIPDHHYHHHQKKLLDGSNNLEDHSNPPQENNNNNNNNNNSNATTTQAKSPVCSSTSETSKGSELSLSRADNRSKARERARGLTSSKKEREKEKETDSTRVNMLNQVNNHNSISDNSSFTDLLTGGININTVTTAVRSPMEYFFNRVQQTPSQLFQLPQFSLTSGDNNNDNDNDNNNNNNLHQFSFLQQDNLNSFSMTSPSSSSGGVAPGGYTRGTLQSNLPLSVLPHHLQRFQQSAIDGSNIPFFVVPNGGFDHHFPAAGGYHFSYGGGGDHHKDKGKN